MSNYDPWVNKDGSISRAGFKRNFVEQYIDEEGRYRFTLSGHKTVIGLMLYTFVIYAETTEIESISSHNLALQKQRFFNALQKYCELSKKDYLRFKVHDSDRWKYMKAPRYTIVQRKNTSPLFYGSVFIFLDDCQEVLRERAKKQMEACRLEYPNSEIHIEWDPPNTGYTVYADDFAWESSVIIHANPLVVHSGIVVNVPERFQQIQAA